jgi:hypothetical protein
MPEEEPERQLVSPQRAVRLAYAIVLPVLALTLFFTWWLVRDQVQPPAQDEFRLADPGVSYTASLGKPLVVGFTVVNHQPGHQIFWVEALSQGQRIGVAGPFMLPPSQALSEQIELYPMQVGTVLPVKLLLHRGSQALPQSSLDLKIQVLSPK